MVTKIAVLISSVLFLTEASLHALPLEKEIMVEKQENKPAPQPMNAQKSYEDLQKKVSLLLYYRDTRNIPAKMRVTLWAASLLAASVSYSLGYVGGMMFAKRNSFQRFKIQVVAIASGWTCIIWFAGLPLSYFVKKLAYDEDQTIFAHKVDQFLTYVKDTCIPLIGGTLSLYQLATLLQNLS